MRSPLVVPSVEDLNIGSVFLLVCPRIERANVIFVGCVGSTVKLVSSYFELQIQWCCQTINLILMACFAGKVYYIVDDTSRLLSSRSFIG